MLNLIKAMQIECYIPRLQLPFAPIEPIEPIHTNQFKTGQNLKSDPNQNIQQTQTQTQTQITDKPLVKSDLKPVLEPNLELNLDLDPSFNLQLLRSQKCLILLDLPDKRSLFAHQELDDLLQAILRAAKLDPNYQTIGEPLFWPLFKSKIITQDSLAAAEYVQNVINYQTVPQNFRNSIREICCVFFVSCPDTSMYNILITFNKIFFILISFRLYLMVITSYI